MKTLLVEPLNLSIFNYATDILSLRHSFAYNFLKKRGEMYQLQAILGHRSIDVTVDLYGQLQAQDIKCPSPYEENFGEE